MHPRPVYQEPTAGRPRPLLLSIDLQTGRITAAGELDRAVAHRLADALDALTLTSHRAWTVEATAVTFCDAAGLRVLAAGSALAEERGCTLQVVGASPFTARLLRLVGMGALLDTPAPRVPLGVA
ncbi:STAS domain-containing protein [Geodermatophilus sp. DSM 44513]|uniref:STAS domain-containing protein n=1 Tax=Geodermatophilus sp. DSM 44513 TaxID=1528104 RepID=UPI0012892678|nr:STAS domain-containing protein [Geodermatophilus sp. DSM 44513]WNV74101.1 STAS domain-containing protein [Geodermatophilus sp. DSM 44513]